MECGKDGEQGVVHHSGLCQPQGALEPHDIADRGTGVQTGGGAAFDSGESGVELQKEPLGMGALRAACPGGNRMVHKITSYR